MGLEQIIHKYRCDRCGSRDETFGHTPKGWEHLTAGRYRWLVCGVCLRVVEGLIAGEIRRARGDTGDGGANEG